MHWAPILCANSRFDVIRIRSRYFDWTGYLHWLTTGCTETIILRSLFSLTIVWVISSRILGTFANLVLLKVSSHRFWHSYLSYIFLCLIPAGLIVSWPRYSFYFFLNCRVVIHAYHSKFGTIFANMLLMNITSRARYTFLIWGIPIIAAKTNCWSWFQMINCFFVLTGSRISFLSWCEIGTISITKFHWSDWKALSRFVSARTWLVNI